MRLREARRDPYRRLAKERGYRSRAAFKLKELSRSYNVIKRGMVVVDFGCAPGGWLQVASEEVGEDGFVLGIDLLKVKPPHKNTKTLVVDVNDSALPDIIAKELPRSADVILSDIAPKVTGIWELDHSRQIDLTSKVASSMPKILREGGSAILKVFDGEMLKPFLDELKSKFVEVRLTKPRASRKESSEIYLVCSGYLGE